MEAFSLIFFAVADGHGVNGHHVSGLMQKNLPNNILKFINTEDINEMSITNGIRRGFGITN
jgi:serine/threonine protein phosphatase PrpC